jgi:large-conductance mechanosensitive channel
MNKKDEILFKQFIIKYTVVASVITWVISSQLKDLIEIIVNNIIEPIFSFDIDGDGNPDIQQLKNMITEFFGCKFQFGKIILALIKAMLSILIIYGILLVIYRYTDLLKL